MSRLWVRLSVAFAVVTLVGVVAAAVLSNRQMVASFLRFAARVHVTGVLQHEGAPVLLSALADFHEERGSWDGVEALLGPGAAGGSSVAPRGPMRGVRRQLSSLILTDDAHRVVYDGSGGELGRTLAREERTGALPVTLGDTEVGYVVIGAARTSELSRDAQTYLREINRTLLRAGLLAALLAALVGVVLARSLSAPLSRLAHASRRVSRGDLDSQVPETGAAEVVDLSRAFNEMTAELRRAETLRRNMVADIAHELRTPLSVIQGNLRAMLDGVYPLDRDEVQTVHDETLVLGRLIDDLHDLARAESGQLHLELQPVRLDDVVRRAVDAFAESAESAGVALRSELPAEAPVGLVDADRVGQILRNLIANALRYTPSGGSVTVRALSPEAGLVRLEVEDTGAGIASADLPYVFDRFWRADASRSRTGGGSGLGLAIARQLAEAHGGSMHVESTEGEGARFWFTVPAADEA